MMDNDKLEIDVGTDERLSYLPVLHRSIKKAMKEIMLRSPPIDSRKTACCSSNWNEPPLIPDHGRLKLFSTYFILRPGQFPGLDMFFGTRSISKSTAQVYHCRSRNSPGPQPPRALYPCSWLSLSLFSSAAEGVRR